MPAAASTFCSRWGPSAARAAARGEVVRRREESPVLDRVDVVRVDGPRVDLVGFFFLAAEFLPPVLVPTRDVFFLPPVEPDVEPDVGFFDVDVFDFL